MFKTYSSSSSLVITSRWFTTSHLVAPVSVRLVYRAPLLCYFKLCASFRGHWWVQTGFTVREKSNLGQIRRILEPCDLEIWRMTLKNIRAPLLSNIKLYASFHHHMGFQTGVTVWKRLSWVLTSVTLTFDLWPWLFAWTSLLSLVRTPENFMMIRWWKHCQKGVTDRRTDGQTDRQTDWTINRAAWSQLKIEQITKTSKIPNFNLFFVIKNPFKNFEAQK